jgi:hypothetical protein
MINAFLAMMKVATFLYNPFLVTLINEIIYLFSVSCEQLRLLKHKLQTPVAKLSQQPIQHAFNDRLPSSPVIIASLCCWLLLPKNGLCLAYRQLDLTLFAKMVAETNIERYVSHFGASPQSHSAIFSDLQTTQIKAAQITKPSVLPFLMAMYWLKTYQSESVMAGTFKVDEKTVRTYVWKYVLAIQALKEQKVNAKWKS